MREYFEQTDRNIFGIIFIIWLLNQLFGWFE